MQVLCLVKMQSELWVETVVQLQGLGASRETTVRYEVRFLFRVSAWYHFT